ncbi:MAG: hypothetical protein PUE85_02390 [Firmicutes bacterium]|nr:hypothetical protein [Bacillota bacterium]
MDERIQAAIKKLKSSKATENAAKSAAEELASADLLIQALERRAGDLASGMETEYIKKLKSQREELYARYLYCSAKRRSIQRALNSLDEAEKTVLEVFYRDKPSDAHCLDILMERLGYEKTQIYRIRAAALTKFTEHLFGIAD